MKSWTQFLRKTQWILSVFESFARYKITSGTCNMIRSIHICFILFKIYPKIIQYWLSYRKGGQAPGFLVHDQILDCWLRNLDHPLTLYLIMLCQINTMTNIYIDTRLQLVFKQVIILLLIADNLLRINSSVQFHEVC